jgi:hypothetical protein
MIRIVCMLIVSVLFFIGGWRWHNARRFILPAVMAATAYWLTRDLWCLTMLSAMGVFCMGYGEDAPLVHVFGKGWGRGIWGFLGALALSLGLFLTGHLAWYWFAAYLVAGFILENALKNLYQVAGDLIIGAFYGSLLLAIR